MSAEAVPPTARVERILPAAVAESFDAWLDPRALAQFICPAPGRASRVEIDPRVGGRLLFVMSFPDHEIEVTGEYVALDRPERLMFTWRCSDTGDLESLVTIVFAPAGEDETLMTIMHTRQPAQLVAKHEAGWSSVADRLEASIAQRRASR
jgi:uncharacterized protein YndB with AHSA1/START domain